MSSIRKATPQKDRLAICGYEFFNMDVAMKEYNEENINIVVDCCLKLVNIEKYLLERIYKSIGTEIKETKD